MADAATVQAQQRDTIGQLESARTLALEDASYYQQIVPGVLPIVGARAGLPLRQWGAGFLSETLASPRLPAAEKEQLSRVVLPTLRDYLDSPAEHPTVVKSAVQAVTSAYPFVFLRW